MNLKKGTLIGDRFEIDRPLSQNGGTASVYLGNLADDNRVKIVIKISKTDPVNKTHEDDLLLRESELLCKPEWRHPGVVRVFPVPLNDRSAEYCLRAVNVPGQPYFVIMEYLEGQSLAENLSRIRRFPLDWKLDLFYRLAIIVSFLHQKEFGHRDLKPANIVFRRPVSETISPEPVLIDFALTSNGREGSKIVDSSYTLEYASPERVLKSMGIAYEGLANYPLEADIWSLGVILYEIITGELLFKGNHHKIRTTIINESIKLLEDDIQLSDVLRFFIQGMLNRQPAKRPTISQVLYALEDNFLPPRVPIQAYAR